MSTREPRPWSVFWDEFQSRHPEAFPPGTPMPMPTKEAPPLPPRAPDAHEREPGEDDGDDS